MSQTLSRRERSGGLDFTAHMRRLCVDLTMRHRELAHIDMSRVAVSFCQTRKAVGHGLQATLTPLRFAGGATETLRRGQPYTVQRVVDASGQEMLYLLSFYLPRFLNHPFEEKLTTVIHELWHISPQFDGDLRRHEGRCYIHSHSQREYDARMTEMAREWLQMGPPAEVHEFLSEDFGTLMRRHGSIFGVRIARPKLIPVRSAARR